MECERCGKLSRGYDLHDYCATCGRNKCADCAALGCCGAVPMASGMAIDFGEETRQGEEHGSGDRRR